VKGSYFINRKVLRMASRKLIVMHHLPRIDEIPLEVDLAPQGHYFQQAANGLPARMALLSEIVE
jgi:aspartate carbamoyltransferase catalytic subunit